MHIKEQTAALAKVHRERAHDGQRRANSSYVLVARHAPAFDLLPLNG
jgi:hypothetical protein